MKKNTLSQVYDVTVQKVEVGKSTFSQALAYSFANQGFNTCILTSSYKRIVEKKHQ
jgi:Mrp family chromosome partitioning ATPase